ncbi:MAG: glycosyltransferase [Chloracidobacterium sp.]|nr:glycosyltransferase [Chloracidobacterium sp.]
MNHKILFVDRKPFESVSIERVFDQISKDIPADQFDIESQKMPYGNSPLDILLNLLFFRPKLADIYHITGQIHYMALRLPADKTVLTIHDLVFLHRRTGVRRYVLKKLFLDLPVKRLKFITAISQATKDEIVKYTHCDPGKIRVIENPLVNGLAPEPIKPFDQKRPIILQIGTSANKNVPNLIRALDGVNCRLRIIGRVSANIKEALATSDVQFENVFDLGTKDMIEEYRNADIIAFCSTYEGFGLPIIEAQAMKKPVITSYRSPMKDVAGAGAFLADPNDVIAIRNGLIKIINEPKYREELVLNGTRNILRFSSKSLAAEYLEIYESVLGN